MKVNFIYLIDISEMNTQTVILFSLLGNSSSVGKSMKTPTKPLNPQTKLFAKL